jgi:hypothetical protein
MRVKSGSWWSIVSETPIINGANPPVAITVGFSE